MSITARADVRHEARAGEERRARRARLAACALVAGAVVLVGGYVGHWSWTGINGHTATLWDWLKLTLLPLVIGFLPIWLSRRTRLTQRHRRLSAVVLSAFAVLVLFGYLIPWAWTGFAGNTLWDWLGLVALPLALALTPIYEELHRNWTPRYSLIAAGAIGLFAIVVVGGYMGHWAWTGFRGNTVWDWLHLLLLPLLIPLIAVPALRPIAMAGVTFVKPGTEHPADPEDDDALQTETEGARDPASHLTPVRHSEIAER